MKFSPAYIASGITLALIVYALTLDFLGGNSVKHSSISLFLPGSGSDFLDETNELASGKSTYKASRRRGEYLLKVNTSLSDLL